MTLSSLHLFRNSSTHTKDLVIIHPHPMSLIWRTYWAILPKSKIKLLIPISIKLSKTTWALLTHNTYSMMTKRLMLPKAKGKHLNLKSSPRMSQWWTEIIASISIQPETGGRISLKFKLVLISQDPVISKNCLQQSNWMLHQI